MGAVLSQIQDGKEKVIAYYSKAFSRTERKYCVTRRELLVSQLIYVEVLQCLQNEI
jgi:predicted SnoaL-like aldol condensation-catalyzing enzyme